MQELTKTELATLMTGMSNGAAIGYMIKAARNLGFIDVITKALERGMQAAMDSLTEDEAEAVYRQF